MPALSEPPLVSVIIPTFNSAGTLPLVLDALDRQNYPRGRMEILVVDGGSTDHTRAIAVAHDGKVLDNPKVQQEYAKHIGMMQARGQYAIFVDSDEVLENQTAIEARVGVLERQPDVKLVLTGGYKRPAGASSVNDYINTFSDPFAFFMYGISTDYRQLLRSYRRLYRVAAEMADCVIFQFTASDALPLVDMCAGCCVNLDFLRAEFGERLRDAGAMPRIFYMVATRTGRVAILKEDAVIHYSADRLGKFLNKISWRVIANMHYRSIPGTGFANREEFQPRWFRLKKYLFLPYACTVILPLAEAIYYALARRMPANLLHLPLVLYTAWLIGWHFLLRLLGRRPKLRTYGGNEQELAL